MRILLILLSVSCALSACSQKSLPAPERLTKASEFNQLEYSAHWLAPELMLAVKHARTQRFTLYYSIDASIRASEDVFIVGDSPSLELVETAPSGKESTADRHLYDSRVALQAENPLTREQLISIVKAQLVLVQTDAAGAVLTASKIQKARLLDALFTSGKNDADEAGMLGARVSDDKVTFRLWAPTAQQVDLLLFDENKAPLSPSELPMSLDNETGIWSADANNTVNRAFYRYRVRVYHPASNQIEVLRVTDPYSLSLSTNSQYSQVVDLNDPDTKPDGWDRQRVAEVAHYEDSSLYEMHVRDFSASDQAVPRGMRGKYGAFTLEDSQGIRHLKNLRNAGLTHLHLLPVFDIATVNESRAQNLEPWDRLEKMCVLKPDIELCESEIDKSQTLQNHLQGLDPTSAQAQALIEQVREIDTFNWGYDPFHYTVPEGSYAQNPDGIQRLVEFREMIMAIHNMGFRVVMDVVYNHTYAANLTEKSVLDKIVPHYYHRLHPETGEIEQSTCCDNTATEHIMMGKLMVDSLRVWTRDYKIDGFRFDLMGHQPRALMLKAYDEIRKIDPDNYFYGEGWNFGEVANNARFVQATQTELAGSEIGTFNDRLRDTIRGGRPFDEQYAIRRGQGLANGLRHFPNELQNDEDSEHYDVSMNQARVGLVGNLADYPLSTDKGKTTRGRDIPYGGGATGYALDPADTINYVSKHDNQTLWDNNQYRIPFEASVEERVRMQNLALAYPLLSQGIPFIHMGSELLRSKSFLRDSYDYSDWFNAVDFSRQSNNYAVGLPPAVKDENNWPLIREIWGKNQGRDRVSKEMIDFAANNVVDLLKIRYSSPLFRLTSAEDIIDRVSFPSYETIKDRGLIAVHLSDNGKEEKMDSDHQAIMVIFNHSRERQTMPFADASLYRLHPVQAEGSDIVVRQNAKIRNQEFEVPGLSVVVFVKVRA